LKQIRVNSQQTDVLTAGINSRAGPSGITDAAYYRWRKENVSLKAKRTARMKDPERRRA